MLRTPFNRARPRVDACYVHPAAGSLDDSLRLTWTALRAWNRRPGPIVRRWLGGALLAALALLAAVLAIAVSGSGRGAAYLAQPPFTVGRLADVRQILSRNVLVLALHAMACIAGFIAGVSVPVEAAARRGWRRTLRRRLGRAAILFVIAATLASLALQAETIGTQLARVARALGSSPPLLLLAMLPHALPELTALFLPLAAWIVASRRGDWDQLLAATIVTVAIALPVLVVCACWEVFVAPHIVAALVLHG